ncbi:MAG: type IX secretion system sortase PorU [Flammeovirgaceae bacterium]
MFVVSLVFAQNSPFKTGKWHKLEVDNQGVYKISANFLRNMGYDLASINPQKIQIWGNGGGMLPQANDAFRYWGVQENAIMVVGEEDGKFDNNDYVLFYAEGADKQILDLQNQIIRIEKNIYSTKNYYFLTVGEQNGKRIENQENISNVSTVIYNSFDEIYYHELESNNALARLNTGQGAGRLWLGEELSSITPSLNLSVPALGLVENSEIKLQTSLLAQAYQTSTSFSLKINNVAVGEDVSIPPTPSGDPYLSKARRTIANRTLNTNQFNKTDNLTLNLTYKPNAQGGVGFVDYVVLNFRRKLKLYGNQTSFRVLESLNQTYSTFSLENTASNLRIWDVTDVISPKNQLFTTTTQNLHWTFNSENLREFVVFSDNNLPEPSWQGQITNQDLMGAETPDLLVITPEVFLNEAQRLAQFRQTYDGLSVLVATTTQVYNEYSSGKQDVTAIRDLVRHLYLKNNRLKYLLLFGDASYDYLDRVEGNTNFVPVYESSESLDPINSYSSEDFYGMMDENEGNWEETGTVSTYDMEIGVGRLPVSTIQEAKQVVDKLIHYSTAKTALGDWRKRIVFVGDDGDGNTHQEDADLLSKIVDSKQPSFDIEKLYVDAFPKESTGSKEISPIVKNKINEAVERGVMLINYSGHGAETGWASENILDNPQVMSWKNIDRLPIFITATCEYGRYDNPQMRSGAEYAILNPQGGAIALLTTTRPVFAFSNFQLNQALYQTAFPLLETDNVRLGDIFRITKNNSVIGLKNRNFALLGDPSMQIAYPKRELVVTAINDAPLQNNTSLKALQKVKISGEVRLQNNLDAGFNGEAIAVVFDKKSNKSTLGSSGNIRMSYQLQDNVLFKGKATVQNGRFSFTFVVPKDIDYREGFGKISLYAFDTLQVIDATGSLQILVGGSQSNPSEDNTPPNISLYLENEDFVNGDAVPVNTYLYAHLEDESGINNTGFGIGHDLMAILDGDEDNAFILNSFYTTEKDSFTKGSVRYPLNNLQAGKHTLTLRAWDTFNNVSEKSIDFHVENGLVLKNLMALPNPTTNFVVLAFEHNQTGQNLDISAELIALDGAKKAHASWNILGSLTQVNELKFEFTQNIPAGFYVIMLDIKAANGLRKREFLKVIKN